MNELGQRDLTNWRERDRIIRESPFEILWLDDPLRHFVVDVEFKAIPFWGGSLAQAETWILDECRRRREGGE